MVKAAGLPTACNIHRPRSMCLVTVSIVTQEQHSLQRNLTGSQFDDDDADEW